MIDKSDWFKGLLYAEEMCTNGWVVCEYDAVEQWFSWTYKDTETKHTAFGEPEWLDGVRDFYKNSYQNTKRFCEGK